MAKKLKFLSKAHKQELRHKQYADEYLANGMNALKAAKSCRYKGLGPINSSSVVEYIEEQLQNRSEHNILRRRQIIAKLRRVVDFNLMSAISASKRKRGFIEITPEAYDTIAEEIGDCVTEVETVTKQNGDVETSIVRIKLMSKEKMLELEMKYLGMLVERHEVDQRVTIDWEQLLAPTEQLREMENTVEGRVLAYETLTADDPHGDVNKSLLEDK